ncbi:histidine--tRNA ligase [Candidatus Mycalebacterium sp.]
MSTTDIKSIRGFVDILPERSGVWSFLEETAARVFELYGFSQIRTPVLEFTDLYSRGVGETTDLVEKEMYSFTDRDGSEITLRPEGTAGVVRAFIENSLHNSPGTQKLWYSGEMFRHERPQKGRMRGFHQIGAEFFGSGAASEDCETILMLWHFFTEAGITDGLEIEINSIGTPDDRNTFKNALTQFLLPLQENLCDNCARRAQTNPLRALDCKNPDCSALMENAPVMSEFLSAENARHFEEVKERLTALSVPFAVNEKIVRGLDYYTRTVFEVKAAKGLGAQNAVAAGGRYDLLVETFGGSPTPATGFAIGVERAALLLEGSRHERGSGADVFVGWIGEGCFDPAFALCADLRGRGVKTRIEHSASGIRGQIKRADKSGARIMVIIGPDEMEKNVVKIRDMETGDEKELPEKSAAEDISKSVKSGGNG